MAKIGVGLIGCGGRLRGVLHKLIEATDQIEIVALCDPSKFAVERTREVFKDQGADTATLYEDYHDLVNDPKVDWVMIGSYNCYHAEQTIAAFEAGKHVFCEKPLATSVEDCVAMFDAWKKSGKLFNIGFTLRYSPHYRRIKEILSSGKIGDIVSMEFNETLDFNHGGFIHCDWRRKTELAGTHLLEKCCHDVDLVNWMIESPAKRVASFGGVSFFKPENKHHMARVGDSEDGKVAFSWNWRENVEDGLNPFEADKDIIDNQVAIVEYENGVRTTFHTNCVSGIPERRMYICGTEGALRADVIAGKIEVRRYGWNTEMEDGSTDASGGHGGGDEILGQSLADMMLKGEDPAATLEDGLRSAVTCFGIDKAMETGAVVEMAPYWKQAGILA